MSHPPQMDRIPVKGFALRSRARQRHASRLLFAHTYGRAGVSPALNESYSRERNRIAEQVASEALPPCCNRTYITAGRAPSAQPYIDQ